jgi:hypothetical protein
LFAEAGFRGMFCRAYGKRLPTFPLFTTAEKQAGEPGV